MSSTENFQRMWFIFKLATETQMPDFESNSPTVTCSCQVWLKGADKMTKAKPKAKPAPQDAEHTGLWGAGSCLERSEPTQRGAWVRPRFYLLLTKISTVQLSQALSTSLRGTEESATVEKLTAALGKSKMSKFVKLNWAWVKTADCFKVPATRNFGKGDVCQRTRSWQ